MYSVKVMQFFDNEIVRSEAAEMMQIYEDIVDLMGSAKFKSPEGLELYLNKVSRMIELQEMIYFRAKYSSEEDAQEFVTFLNMSFPLVAVEGETDVTESFRRMKSDIERMKQSMHKGG